MSHWMRGGWRPMRWRRSEEHTSELQSQSNLVCRLLLEKKKNSHALLWPAAHSVHSVWCLRPSTSYRTLHPTLFKPAHVDFSRRFSVFAHQDITTNYSR